MKRIVFLWFLMITRILIAHYPGKTALNYNVQIWDTESGLLGNSVFALLQTQDGYLWIGTQDGLVSFDGVHFEVFTMDNTPQLKSNEIRALYADRNNILWIGTSTGGLTCLKNGEFFACPMAENNTPFDIRAIAEDRRGNLWIGSLTAGLTCMHNDKFTPYPTVNDMLVKEVRFIYIDKNQDLWVAASAGVVKVMEPGKFQTYATPDVLPHLKTACLYEIGTGNLWIGTGDASFFKLKNGKATVCRTETDVQPGSINTLYKDRRENLWIGTDGAGLMLLDDGKLRTVLACGSVYAIAEDNEGGLWVGTLDRGLYRLNINTFTTLTASDGLSHDIVHCIIQGRDDLPWVGTEGGLACVKNGLPSTVMTTGEGLLNNLVSCLFEDTTGNLWIGTWGGLHTYKNGKLTILTQQHGLSDDRVKCILEDKQGNTWIGTENGLNRYDRATGKFEIFTTERGLSGNTIRFILEHREGELLVGTNGGLDRIKDGEITAYPYTAGEGDYLLECAYEDKEGRLWLGTDRGLLLARRNPGGKQEKMARGRLTENQVSTILEDDLGNLWLGGKRGIARVTKTGLVDFAMGKTRELTLQTFNEKDGMKSRWVIGPGCKTQDDRLWFPTSMGVVVVDPNEIKSEAIVSPPVIEKFMVDGEIIRNKRFSGGTGAPRRGEPIENFFEKSPLAAGGVLELAPGKKRVEIYYTAVSFNDPRKVKFRTKLEDYDHDWAEVGSLRNAVYIGLRPGRYTFKVAAGNQDGAWNPAEAVLSFYLSPYFYQTPWFYLIVVLSILTAAFTFYRIRVSRLKNREKELSALVDIRTHDLKERTIELETAHHHLQESKEIIEAKNRHIMDSIHYARKIQRAMLPTKEKMAKELNDYFVVFKPKDIVSGDFYWFDVIENQYFIAVADCTGHGVPGALLSMIGYMMLNEVVEEKRIFDPARVLSHLHQGFRTVLKQELNRETKDKYDTYDGMDLGLCRIDMNSGQITFAGAGLSLFYIKNSELVEIKGSRKSIGGRQREEIRFFTNHQVSVPIGENGVGELMIYMTTDGYADQHNPLNQKFGTRRLKELLRDNAGMNAARQQEALLNALAAHQGNEEQRDDITVIGMRLRIG